MSVNSKMTAIANKIRALLGITGTMGMDAMASNIGKAQEEVDNQAALIEQLRTILAGKAGGIVPTGIAILTENGIHDVTQYASAVVDVKGSGNGLPEGITALSFGQVDLTGGTIKTRTEYPHGLGKTPDFYMLFIVGANIDDLPNAVLSISAVKQNIESEGEIIPVSEVVVHTDDGGYLTTSVNVGGVEDYFDDTNIIIHADYTRRVRVGYYYYWIAGCYNH